jgi:hypothetical protein
MSKESTVYKFYSEMPPWAKGVFGVAIVAGLGFAAYKTYKYFSDKAAQKDSSLETSEIESQYNQLSSTGQKLSYNKDVYMSAANFIKNQLDGCEGSKAESDVVDEILRIVKKPIDWTYLVKVFGVRNISDCLYGSTPYALPELLKGQLGHASGFTPFSDTYSQKLINELAKRKINL